LKCIAAVKIGEIELGLVNGNRLGWIDYRSLELAGLLESKFEGSVYFVQCEVICTVLTFASVVDRLVKW
jgi:hypothetical protein